MYEYYFGLTPFRYDRRDGTIEILMQDRTWRPSAVDPSMRFDPRYKWVSADVFWKMIDRAREDSSFLEDPQSYYVVLGQSS